MRSLATIGNVIEVRPRDDVQYWAKPDSDWISINDRTPFTFRVSGELIDGDTFYGLHGSVIGGAPRYKNLICSIMLRLENSDWHKEAASAANFKVAPSIVEPVLSYDDSNLPFYAHPEGTMSNGYPRFSRFGSIRLIDESNPPTKG